jgi:F0F1-type ATP synthase assembly protein I
MADERLQTGPLFVLLGTFIGFGAGFYTMYRSLVLEPRRTRKDDEPESD